MIRRLAAVVTFAIAAASVFATPALAATKSKVDRFDPIVPMLVMLAIGALIFGVAYVLDKRKD